MLVPKFESKCVHDKFGTNSLLPTVLPSSEEMALPYTKVIMKGGRKYI